MQPPRTTALALTAVLCAYACVEPLQNGGVAIYGDPASRLETICRFRRDASSESFCASEAPARPPARVRRIASEDSALKGPHAAAIPGDYVLENDEIAVVIDQLGAGRGLAEGGGNLIDAAAAGSRVDALGQLFVTLGAPQRQVLYEKIQAGSGDDGSAWIDVEGRGLRDPSLYVRTRYSLAPGSRAVGLSTTLVNTGAAVASGLDLGDAVLWGGAEPGAAGSGAAADGDAGAAYLYGVGSGVAYALTSEGRPLSTTTIGRRSSVVYARGASIAPGATATYTRMLVVAPRGDAAAITTEMFFLSGGAPGGVEIDLAWEGKAPSSLAGARIALRRSCSTCPAEPFPAPRPLWLSVAPGANTAELPPGRYAARLEGPAGASPEVEIDVAAGATTKASLKARPGGLLRASVVEVEPADMESARAEWQKSGARAAGLLKGKATPSKLQIFDAASGERVSVAIAGAPGRADVPLPSGRYRVVASRGPEFTLDEATVEIASGHDASIELGLVRAVDTRGHLACDLDAHTARGLDAAETLEERLLASAAEGVECVALTERNAVIDPAPAVASLGLRAHLGALAGEEAASDASREPFGHLGVLPMTREPTAARGGALKVLDRTARDVIEQARALPGDRVVTVRHPRLAGRGYFDLLRFNAAAGSGDDPAYSDRFDAVDVWTGRDAAERERALKDIFALLRASRPVTPTASSYAHDRATAEPGYPRTLVAVADDDPSKMDAADLVAGLRKRRDVVLTNGPFVTMRVGEARQGGLASVGARKRAELTVRIERAPWVDATEVTIFVGGVAAVTAPLTGTKKTERGALLDELTFPVVSGKRPVPRGPGGASVQPSIAVAEDTFAVAVVRGHKPLAVIGGDPAEAQPFAMTAPLWIDADGDGRSLGR